MKSYTRKEVIEYHKNRYNMVDGVVSIDIRKQETMMMQHFDLWCELEIEEVYNVHGDPKEV